MSPSTLDQPNTIPDQPEPAPDQPDPTLNHPKNRWIDEKKWKEILDFLKWVVNSYRRLMRGREDEMESDDVVEFSTKRMLLKYLNNTETTQARMKLDIICIVHIAGKYYHNHYWLFEELLDEFADIGYKTQDLMHTELRVLRSIGYCIPRMDV